MHATQSSLEAPVASVAAVLSAPGKTPKPANELAPFLPLIDREPTVQIEDFSRLHDAGKRVGGLFDNDAIQSDWAAASNNILKSTLSAGAFRDQVNRLDVECREALCRIDIVWLPDLAPEARSALEQKWIQAFGSMLESPDAQERFDNAVVQSLNGTDKAGGELRVYLHRQDRKQQMAAGANGLT